MAWKHELYYMIILWPVFLIVFTIYHRFLRGSIWMMGRISFISLLALYVLYIVCCIPYVDFARYSIDADSSSSRSATDGVAYRTFTECVLLIPFFYNGMEIIPFGSGDVREVSSPLPHFSSIQFYRLISL
jgi:hypothetical protein